MVCLQWPHCTAEDAADNWIDQAFENNDDAVLPVIDVCVIADM